MSMSWKRLASILWNSRAILFWILVLAGIGVGLFTDTKNTLIGLAFVVSFLVVLGFTYYCLEEIKYRREDWGLYPDFDGLLVGLQLIIGFLWCSFIVEPLLFYEGDWDSPLRWYVPLLFLPLLAFSMLAYYSLVLKWRNAIFYVRSFMLLVLAVCIFGLSRAWFFRNNEKIASWEQLGFTLLGLIDIFFVCSLAIKGFMITFGANAQKVFPSERRKTKWHEVFLVIFLSFAPILIWKTNILKLFGSKNCGEVKNATEQVEINERTTDGMLNN